MRRRTRLVALATALPLLLSLTPTAVAADDTPTTTAWPTGPRGEADGGARTVTLITGDEVTLVEGADGVPSVVTTAGPGRRDISFAVETHDNGSVTVIPSDAVDYLAKGLLDPRLFEVTRLAELGYDDASVSILPLVLEHKRGTGRSAHATRDLDVDRAGLASDELGLTAVKAAKGSATARWKKLVRVLDAGVQVDRVWLDGQARVSLDESVDQVDAPEAWEAGFTGEGVTVAVLDSGYDTDHPMLAGRVGMERNFTSEPSVEDLNGHGTHTASTVGGRVMGDLQGVAPESTLAIGKVCTASGACPDSAIIEGMIWAVLDADADVVSMSLGAPDSAGVDLVENAVNVLSEATGALFVVAAGNSGEEGLGTVESPGTADAALSVAAVNRDESLATFSSRGARQGDFAVKPEISAPGVGIVAAAPGGGSQPMTGTSMATPHVAGAAALVAQAHPEWDGEELKSALMAGASANPDLGVYHQGTGRLDADQAALSTVTVSPANLSTSPGWMRTAGSDAQHVITYSNHSASPVTLALDLSTPSSPGGQSGNPEMFTLNTRAVTVPADGSASVTLNVHDVMPRGAQGAVLTARSADGTVSVRSIVADYTPVPKRTVTVTSVGRDGLPAGGSVELVDRYTGVNYWAYLSDGVGTASVPESDYYVVKSVSTRSDGTSTLVVEPVTVAGDTDVVLDARKGVSVRVGVDDATVEGISLIATANLAVAEGTRSYSVSAGRAADFDKLYVAPLADENATLATMATFARTGSGSAAPSSVFYHLFDTYGSGIPSEPTVSHKRAKLVSVRADYRALGVPTSGLTGSVPVDPDYPGQVFDHPMAMPSQVIDYRTPGAWYDRISAGRLVAQNAPRLYGPGYDNTITWNAGVAGPSTSVDSLARLGDSMGLNNNQGFMWFAGQGVATTTDWGATGTVRLESDGQVLRTWNAVGLYQDGAAVPAGKHRFTLTGVVTRQQPYAALSTRVETVWGFESDTTQNIEVMPLLTVRADAQGLDLSNLAAPHSTTVLDLTVVPSPNAAQSEVTDLALEVSYDDGSSWEAVPVSNGQARVKNLASGFVSLRATAADAAGSTVTQTIVRAWGTR